jgi:hypothetical protein
MDYSPKKLKRGSTVGSVVAFVREVRLPVGVHLLTLLIEAAGRRELVFAHLRGSVHGRLGGANYRQTSMRRPLTASQCPIGASRETSQRVL